MVVYGNRRIKPIIPEVTDAVLKRKIKSWIEYTILQKFEFFVISIYFLIRKF